MTPGRSLVCGSLAAALALCAGCAAPGPASDQRVVTKLQLAPDAVHEECASLVPGDRIDYRFESSDPVAFNIHYHDANSVVMPITRDNATSDAGIYAPSVKQDYCLMWQTSSAGATIAYRMTIRRAAPR